MITKDRIKKHFKDNKERYLFGIGGIALGGAAVFAYLVKHGYAVSDEEIRRLEQLWFESDLNQNVLDMSRSKNLTIKYLNQTISNYGNKIGRPGNKVREIDPTTGRTIHEFMSQTLAAIDAGVSNEGMRKHLDGVYPNVNERIFERINV